MRKPAFCICENKGTGKLWVNPTANQHLCFHYKDKTIPLLPKSEVASLYCIAQFVSVLVEIHEDRFSCDTANLVIFWPVDQETQ